MKIVCEKGNDAQKMLRLVRHLLETEYAEHFVLENDLVITLTSETDNQRVCTAAEEEIRYLTRETLECAEQQGCILEGYDRDGLTHLYNRAKYEQDMLTLQPDGAVAIYIDAVGLHEVNNHLGHSAGDRMLCSIANGLCTHAASGICYRIGGDEFVALCFDRSESEVRGLVAELRAALKKDDYEISVGVAVYRPETTLEETVNRAEEAMRRDKTEFYRKNGAERQIRTMNHKLEKILLEKQDATQFLNAIASDYKGVYIVNPIRDSLRYIYIPVYFQNFLQASNGKYSKAIQMYCAELVHPEDRELFSTIFDFTSIAQRLKRGEHVGFTYRKNDESKVHLQITTYNAGDPEVDEMLWIFMDME